jgi:hypothetical protein
MRPEVFDYGDGEDHCAREGEHGHGEDVQLYKMDEVMTKLRG